MNMGKYDFRRAFLSDDKSGLIFEVHHLKTIDSDNI